MAETSKRIPSFKQLYPNSQFIYLISFCSKDYGVSVKSTTYTGNSTRRGEVDG